MGLSHVKLQKTPLGDKVVIYAARPGIVVGRKGSNIKLLTKVLRSKFNLENPQIEISEVPNVNLDAKMVAEKVANSLERFGIQRFKGVGHKSLGEVMRAGALGAEILISGKVPSSRAKSWRFYQGYLKKSGDIALTGVRIAYATAYLKLGAVGIQVRIMPKETILPDDITILDEPIEIIEETDIEIEAKTSKKSAKKSATKKTSKKSTKKSTKKVVKKEEKVEKPKVTKVKETKAEEKAESKETKKVSEKKVVETEVKKEEKASEEKVETK